jgi:hypothetical protein
MFQRDVGRALGTHFFLACGADEDVRSFTLAHDWLQQQKVTA